MIYLIPSPTDRVRLPRFADFQVERRCERSIELGREGAAEHHTEISAFRPIRLLTHLARYELKELSARKRIGDRNPDVIWLGLPNHAYGFLDFVPSLSRVSKLQKEAAADPEPG